MTNPNRKPVLAHAVRSPDVEIIMPDQYTDRRSEPRDARDGRGALLFLPDLDVVPCHILDSSPSGARVAVDKQIQIAPEIWLLDLDTATVKRGASAWSTSSRMGLKFNFIQKMPDDNVRPPKVPQPVFDAWLKLRHPPAASTKPSDDDVIYFD
ncbi:MAG: hypothetical protein WBQ60_06985 [Asticcacaulis sp.]